MLKEIRIQNFAIIENLVVNFEKGLNVLTGETGAGKSIIIDALNLLVGGRADTDSIISNIIDPDRQRSTPDSVSGDGPVAGIL